MANEQLQAKQQKSEQKRRKPIVRPRYDDYDREDGLDPAFSSWSEVNGMFCAL
jgi:hypothetical protein